MALTQKETTLLQDLKSAEKLCIEKYVKYASEACDGNLKNLFSEIVQTEQKHYDTISGLLGETQWTSTGGTAVFQNVQPENKSECETGGKQKDQYLCEDALSMEKHVSSVYDTCIFEFKDPDIRNTLNSIQKEEQQHGEKIYNYMSQNGMYA